MTDSILSFAQKDPREKTLIRDYIRSFPYVNMLQTKGRIKKYAGKRIHVPYVTNPPTAYSYGRDSVIQPTQKGEIIDGYFDWGAIAVDTKEYGWDIDRNGDVGSLSSGNLLDLVDFRTEEAKQWFFREHNINAWSGTGAAYGGGTDKDFLGLENQVVTTPSSGSHGGLSRSTYDELQNQQISGTAGPSTDWEADAAERILTLKVAIENHQQSFGGTVRPDLLYVTEGSKVDIVNLFLVQNTNVGSKVEGVESVLGMVPIVNHAQDANTVYMLTSSTICWYYPSKWDNWIQLDVRNKFPDRMNPKDTVIIIKSEGCQVVEFPPMNGVITNAG